MFGTSKQTWWKPSPLLARKRATPVVSSVGSTSSIFGLPHPEECDPDPVVRDLHDGLEFETEGVAPEAEGRVDRAHDECDMVDLADAADESGTSRSWSGGMGAAYPVGHVVRAAQSAIVVRVPVPPAVERLRRRWDRAARMGVPAHVTILYPFVAADELDVLGPPCPRAHRGRTPSRSTCASASRTIPDGGLCRSRCLVAFPRPHRRGRGSIPDLPAIRRGVRRGHPPSDRGRVGRRGSRHRGRGRPATPPVHASGHGDRGPGRGSRWTLASSLASSTRSRAIAGGGSGSRRIPDPNDRDEEAAHD